MARDVILFAIWVVLLEISFRLGNIVEAIKELN